MEVENARKDLSAESLHDTIELQREVDYYRAQCITIKLLSHRMITKGQFVQLSGLKLSAYAPRLETELSCINTAYSYPEKP